MEEHNQTLYLCTWMCIYFTTGCLY